MKPKLPEISSDHLNSKKKTRIRRKKFRGPFSIEILAEATGISIDQVRVYQSQGLIPQRRYWEAHGEEIFYTIDIHIIRAALLRQDNIDDMK